MANDNFFMNITFDINYESSSDEEEITAPLAEQPTRSAAVTAANLDNLEKTRHENNTVRQTVWTVNCFKSWLAEKQLNIDLKRIEKSQMNSVLRDFYGSIRTNKGELYGISSYPSLRSALNRHINEPPFSREWNLMQDSEFTSANNVFKGVVKQIRRSGADKTSHYPPMSFEDQQILKRSGALDPGHPKGLLNKVWYDIQLHFARRGKEGNRQLKPDSFELKRDENDTEYFTMTFNEETKNHKNPLEVDRENRRGAMFEEPGNPMCPVSSLKKYLRKIPPDAKALYLHPKRRFDASDDIWYSTVPLGVNQLSQMLSRMCIEAGTQSHYTNHSIRATAIQKLSDAGLQAREIIAISGHRNLSEILLETITTQKKTLECSTGIK
nr:uncharacterized protein LOC129429980 isoform X2 [Misgurnus anguillicaudatus]